MAVATAGHSGLAVKQALIGAALFATGFPVFLLMRRINTNRERQL